MTTMIARRGTIAALTGLAVVLATVTTAVAGPQAAATKSAAGQGYDQAALQKDLDKIHASGIAGVQAEVRTPTGGFSARSGVAQLGKPDPVPHGAHFRMGSNGKTFTATVVLQLVGEGKIKLTDTIDQWLPGVVRGNGNDGRKITVQQILQHTSGIYDHVQDPQILVGWPLDLIVNGITKELFNKQRHLRYTPGQLVRIAMRHKPYFQPGKGWHYSNTGYVLAGMIIRKVTGRDWRREVEDRILKPLGMTHTSAPGHRETMPEPHPHGYAKFLVPAEPWVDATEQNMSFADAAGELITTTADLHQFWRGLLGGRLLKPAQLRTMLTTMPVSGNLRYGLGIGQLPTPCGTTLWFHNGGLHGWLMENGFNADGTRGAVVSVSATPAQQPDGWAKLDAAMRDIVNHALCDTR